MYVRFWSLGEFTTRARKILSEHAIHKSLNRSRASQHRFFTRRPTLAGSQRIGFGCLVWCLVVCSVGGVLHVNSACSMAALVATLKNVHTGTCFFARHGAPQRTKVNQSEQRDVGLTNYRDICLRVRSSLAHHAIVQARLWSTGRHVHNSHRYRNQFKRPPINS